MIKQEISDLIKASIRKLQKSGVLPVFEIPEIAVDYPKEKTHGDYSTNIALQLVKIIFTLRPARRSLGAGGKKPLEVANLLADDLISSGRDLFEKVEVAMPGFINFFISKKELIYQLKEILREKNSYGSSKIGKGKTVVIDYSGPNIAKPFGIGHLRSTIIGQAYCDIYKFLGYKVIGDNHIGDWGTQFGKLIYAIKKWGNEKEIAKSPIKNLLNLYVKFHEEAEKNPDLENEGRKWFKKLEGGDKDAKRLWKKCVGWSMEEFGRIYKPLGIKFDYVLGESFYVPMLKDIIKEALDKKIAKKSQGAIIIEYPSNALPPLMIRKSDGTTLYSTRDLATIKYRLKKFKPIKIIYEVGVDQILHFKQLFWTAELLGWGKKEDYIHIAHGMIRLESGKMRTRKGEIIFLEDVLNEAIERAKKIVEEKNPILKPKEKERIAKIVGIGAVKYNDLSRHPSSEIIFEWGKALNLKGNSGPYLQYTYTRAMSVLRKAKNFKIRALFKENDLKEEKEIKLLKALIHFPEIIKEAAKNYSPNLLCNYLFNLSQELNNFYEALPVLKAEKEIRLVRLALIKAVTIVLKNGLNLLGIKTLEKM